MTGFIIGHIVQLCMVAVLGACFVTIMVGAYYDTWIARRQKYFMHALKRLRTARPHVTVIIDAIDDNSDVVECLRALLKNRYRQFDAVIVTNGTRKNSYVQAVRFKMMHPSAHVRVYARRKVCTWQDTLLRTYAKSERGQFLLTLGSHHVVSTTFVRDSVAHFTAVTNDAKRTAVIFGESVDSDESLVSSLRFVAHTGMHMLCKVFSVTRFGLNGRHAVVVYKKTDVTKKNLLNIRYVFDSMLHVRTSAVNGRAVAYKRVSNRTFISGFVAISLMTYGMAMAALGLNTTVLLLEWLVGVTYFAASIWSYEYAGFGEKIKHSIAVPSSYFFFYILLVIGIIGASVYRNKGSMSTFADRLAFIRLWLFTPIKKERSSTL